MNIGFLASHNGSNMQAIVDACTSGTLHAVPAVVISNNNSSGAISRAKQEGIPCYHLSAKTHTEPEELDQAVLTALLQHKLDVVWLAGYMTKLGPETLSRFPGRMVYGRRALLPR